MHYLSTFLRNGLSFDYLILEKSSKLLVAVLSDEKIQDNHLIRKMSSSRMWRTVRVPIMTHDDYRVVIKLQSSSNGPVRPIYIDNINFEKKACVLYPSEDDLSASTTSSVAPSATTMTPSIVIEETTVAFELNSAEHSATFRQNTTEYPNITVVITEDQYAEKSEKSKRNIKTNDTILLGVVLGVLALVFILLIIFWRKIRGNIIDKLNCNRVSNNRERRYTQCSDNAIYFCTLPSTSDINPVDSRGIGQALEHKSELHLNNERKRSTMGDKIRLFSEDNGVSNAIYDVIENSKRPEDSPCTTRAKQEGLSGAEPEYSNLPFYFARPECKEEDIISMKSCRQVDKESGNDEYNHVNFHRASMTADIADSNRIQESFYDHLNEGNRDVYNETTRVKKSSIIGSDYSHI